MIDDDDDKPITKEEALARFAGHTPSLKEIFGGVEEGDGYRADLALDDDEEDEDEPAGAMPVARDD